MPSKQEKKWEVQWCTLSLIFGALLCNTMVFIGNLETAHIMEELGESSGGWSRVGLGLADSIAFDVDEDMAIVTGNISRILVEVLGAQGFMDEVVSLAGDATETTQGEVALLQAPSGDAPADPSAGIHAITAAVDHSLRQLMTKLVEKLEKLFDLLRPLLLKVGEWVHKFSEQAQGPVETFSLTLDFVQQLFDLIMSEQSGGRTGEKQMIDDTFTLFDVSGTGLVSVQDMQNVSALYSITVLEGFKAGQIVEKLDKNGDGALSRDEFGAITRDDQMYGVLAVVLRTYAKRLSEIAGRVSSARMRDEIASSVVDYFELVCAKNMSKVEWVADALTNGSLPLEFTADVLAQMCLSAEDPDKLSSQSVGSTVMQKMMALNAEKAVEAANLLINISYWESEGFDPLDQPACVERVALWVAQAENRRNSLMDVSSEVLELKSVEDPFGSESELHIEEAEDGAKLALAARSSCEARMHAHVRSRAESRKLVRSRQLSTLAAQELSAHLVGGKDAANPSVAERAVKQSVPAQDSTLLFAQGLANNATSTAQRFRKQCYEYSGALTGQLDGFATQLQALTKKTSSFLKAMEKWSGPAGMERLETKLKSFANNAIEEVLHVVDMRLEKQLAEAPELLVNALNASAHAAGDGLAHTIAEVVSGPLAEPLAEALAKIIAPNASNPENLVEHLKNVMQGEVVHAIESPLGNAIGDSLEGLLGDLVGVDSQWISAAMQKAGTETSLALVSQHLRTSAKEATRPTSEEQRAAFISVASHLQRVDAKAVAQGHVQARLASRRPDIHGAWEEMVTSLSSLARSLPMAMETLKGARGEASKLVKNLRSDFDVFLSRGPSAFEEISRQWRTVWFLYFVFLGLCLGGLAYYTVWALGFWVEAEKVADQMTEEMTRSATERRTVRRTSQDEEDEVAPSAQDRLKMAFAACIYFMRPRPDRDLAFWSCILCMTAIALLVFLISLFLCVTSGFGHFLMSGCAQVYALGDASICLDVLSGLKRTFRSFNFRSGDESASRESMEEELPSDVCIRLDLTTCQKIDTEMNQSAMFVTFFGLLGVALTFQVVLDSAMLHQRSRLRRMKVEDLDEKSDE